MNKDNKNKAKKKNAFYFFMVEKKKEMEVTGQTFRNGLAEVATLVDSDWMNMSAGEREKYVQMANEHNANLKLNANPVKSGFGVTSADLKRIAQEKLNEKDTKERLIFEHLDGFAGSLAKVPVILINYGVYWKVVHELGSQAIPSEVGLNVFSIEKGVYDNFSSLIDPGCIPVREHAPHKIALDMEECLKKTKVLEPDYSNEFQNYKEILYGIDKFLAAHSECKHFFCLDAEIPVVEACFNWLYKRTGESRDFKVLSLNRFIQMLSARGAVEHDDAEAEFVAMQSTSLSKFLAKKYENKIIDQARQEKDNCVMNYVCYPPEHPLIQARGIFLKPDHVDSLLMRHNYAYYPELGCLYHLEIGDGIQFCSQNIVNRYAFSLMDAMLPNFRVCPNVGTHYPEVKDTDFEIQRRKETLRKWTSVDYSSVVSMYTEELVRKEEEMTQPKIPMPKFSVVPKFGRNKTGRYRTVESFMNAMERSANITNNKPKEKGPSVWDLC